MNKAMEWVLRVGVAGEFLGHGALALQGKPQWIGWFANFGVTDAALAANLLWIVGAVDVVLAVLILIRPVPLAFLYMTVWGFWTAILRPIVGESIWDFVERSANWAVPLSLLLYYGWPKNLKEWFGSSSSSRGTALPM